MTIEDIDQNHKGRDHLNKCPANVCPLDPEAALRKILPGEKRCPFTINKRAKDQKGTRTLAPDSILEVIPESNVKLLNKRNKKLWHALHAKIF